MIMGTGRGGRVPPNAARPGGKEGMKKLARYSRLAEMAEIPAEVLFSVSRVEIVGGSKVRIENQRGIAHFERSQVIVIVPEGRLVIEGRALTIDWVDRPTMVITGQVNTLRFEGRPEA